MFNHSTMIPYSRTVQVGDLLSSPSSDDLMTRTQQPIDTLPNITSDLLDITMKITAVNNHEVWITIIWLKAKFHEACDYSWQEYIRSLEILEEDGEIIRFAHDSESDDTYPISTRDNTISLLDPITQLIKLHEPVSKVAPWHVFDDNDDQDFTKVSNIIFT